MKTLFKTTLAFSLILAIICTSVICCFAESTVTEENTSVTLFISVTNRNGEKLDGHHIRLTDFSKNTHTKLLFLLPEYIIWRNTQ